MSIQYQTFSDFDVWIVDGNSKDGTQAYLESLDEPFHYISELDNGIYDAMNKGVLKSTGKWVYFLGADDRLLNEDVLLEFSRLNILEETSIVAGKVKYFKEDVPFIYSKEKNIKNPSWNFSMWIRNGLHHQGTFYKRALFKNNLFDLKYAVLADYAFNLNAYRKNITCIKTDLTIAQCSGKGISKSGTWALYKEEYSLKIKESSLVFGLFHYVVVTVKFLLRKRINV